jgi:hypothetical protein
VAEADLLGSAELVAVIVAVVFVAGAVYNPLEVILPSVALHVTAVLVVPVTDAVNCCIPPIGKLTLAGLIVITTPEEATVTSADADFMESAMLVAVTVTVPGFAGAVNRPLESMLPADADHDTEVFAVPVTVAVNCCVAPTLSDNVAGVTVTFRACGPGMLPPPLPDIALEQPHSAIKQRPNTKSAPLLRHTAL